MSDDEFTIEHGTEHSAMTNGKLEPPDTSIEETIGILALHRGEPIVTTLYLDVDGKRWPRQAEIEEKINTLFRRARQKVARLSAEEASAAQADLAQAHRWLVDSFERAGKRSLAVFACDAQGLFEVLTLPIVVHDQVAFAPTPSVGQLYGALDGGRAALVVLVNHETARFLRIRMGTVEEESALIDPRERQADRGVELGSFERRAAEEVLRHVRRAVRETVRELEEERYPVVLVGGHEDAVSRFLDHLPPLARRRVVGTFALSMTASSQEVAAAVLPLIEESERADEAALIDRLFDRASAGRRAVVGLPSTLVALSEERVETLVLARDFSAPGARCTSCGMVQEASSSCTRCAGDTEALEDVVEDAIEQAIAQKASVRVCADGDIDIFGSIGAFERY